ncbi:MAG: hypothetical protein RL757_2968 [Bacteroidota bacterium]|jgi:F-type H+-transporting ATPase subunit delta
MSRVAGRYAKSLMELAQERGALQSVVGDVQYFVEAAKNKDLAALLRSPIISADKKNMIFDKLFGSFDETTKGFMKLCISKNRENVLPEIANELLVQYQAMQQITTIKITSAAPLSEAAVEEIRQRFQLATSTAKNVDIETAINPDLIGGFVVEYGDKRYDASVASKIKGLRKEFSVNLYDSKIEKHGTV